MSPVELDAERGAGPDTLEIAVVIPTFNEKANVAALIDKLDQALAGRRWEAIFVDDDSPDGTAEHVAAVALPGASGPAILTGAVIRPPGPPA